MTVDIGVIGAGNRCLDHLDTLGQMDDVTVVALADVDEARAEQAARPHGACVYEDPRSLLTSEDPDALVVGLPPFVHTDTELRAAKRGIHLFVEPPVGLSMEKVREVETAVERNALVAQVGYQRRYADAFREAASILEERAVGMIDGYCTGGVVDLDWWRERSKSGGQVVEQATHVYDAVRFFGGEIEEVTAYGANKIVETIDFEDVVTTSMRHERGTVSHVASSSTTHDGGTGIEVFAENAHLHLRGNTLTGHVEGESVEYEGRTDPSVEQLRSFVSAVRDGDESDIAAPYADARKTLAVTFAVNESIRRGEPIVPTV